MIESITRSIARARRRLVFFAVASAIGFVFYVASANAVSTFHFLLDDADSLAAGEIEGTAVNSDGTVTVGVRTKRVELKNIAIARCILRANDGAVYIGTGNKGEIYKLQGNTVTRFAETGQLLVTSLVKDKAGRLYAGTLPSGKIFAIDKRGKVSEFASPEGAEHIWSLVYHAKRNVIYAATGPEGKVFAIDQKGKSKLYYDADADHVMTLALDDRGVLYGGTSDEALLVRLRAPKRVEVVYDFPGNEVTDISIKAGVIAVAANEFPKGPSTSKKKKTNSNSDKIANSNTEKKHPVSPKKTTQRPKKGKGSLWRVTTQGEAEELLMLDKDHLTKVQWAKNDVIYAAAGQEGRIYRVKADGEHAVWIDVDERQVLDMDLTSNQPLFVTGDAGAIYKVASASKGKAHWTSEPLDAKVLSRFGELEWRGKGAIRFQTRSGNTEKPDSSWTEWSSLLSRPGPIRSPRARFLQIRAHLSIDPDTVLYAVRAFYLPKNQRAIVKEIKLEPHRTKRSIQRDQKKSGKNPSARFPKAPTKIYKITWKVENPDDDQLRYRLKYRAEGQKQWREALRETEILTEKQFEWDTSGIPDGYYQIRVSASDELDNPKPTSLEMAVESEPVLIDNHAPRIDALRVVGKNLQGKARDDMGPITRLEYAIDGRDWILFFPSDDLFDTAEEKFSLILDDLKKGSHIIAVRATDAAGNSASSEVTIP